MADEIDKAVRDYLTGKLEVKIKIREIALSAKNPAENIGGSKSRTNEAEQAMLVEKLETDPMLVKWRRQLILVPEWLKTVDDLTHNIIVMRFKYDCSWIDIGQSNHMDERTARRRYSDFKSSLKNWINERQ